jgi:hypothetical protein
MDNHLEVLLTQTFDRKPLVFVRNFPGGDAYLTPVQLRRLAAALVQAADESEAQPWANGHFSSGAGNTPWFQTTNHESARKKLDASCATPFIN